jgi:hypothetical protein
MYFCIDLVSIGQMHSLVLHCMYQEMVEGNFLLIFRRKELAPSAEKHSPN